MYHHRECTQFIGHCLIHLDLGRITKIILIQNELDSSEYKKMCILQKPFIIVRMLTKQAK